jgi:hypothetical protein
VIVTIIEALAGLTRNSNGFQSHQMLGKSFFHVVGVVVAVNRGEGKSVFLFKTIQGFLIFPPFSRYRADPSSPPFTRHPQGPRLCSFCPAVVMILGATIPRVMALYASMMDLILSGGWETP